MGEQRVERERVEREQRVERERVERVERERRYAIERRPVNNIVSNSHSSATSRSHAYVNNNGTTAQADALAHASGPGLGAHAATDARAQVNGLSAHASGVAGGNNHLDFRLHEPRFDYREEPRYEYKPVTDDYSSYSSYKRESGQSS